MNLARQKGQGVKSDDCLPQQPKSVSFEAGASGVQPRKLYRRRTDLGDESAWLFKSLVTRFSGDSTTSCIIVVHPWYCIFTLNRNYTAVRFGMGEPFLGTTCVARLGDTKRLRLLSGSNIKKSTIVTIYVILLRYYRLCKVYCSLSKTERFVRVSSSPVRCVIFLS